MNTEKKTLSRAIGLLTIRLVLGLVFFMQGFGKVFNIGVENLYQNYFFQPYQDTFIPTSILKFTAYYTSFVELIAGTLLILGIFRRYSLYALATVLVIVSFGHGLLEPSWDMHDVIFRLILVAALLILPQEWDRFSLDRKLFSNSGPVE